MSESSNDHFYENLAPFTDFSDITADEHYAELPGDWHVVVTDIQGSTRAIQEGRYREVNLVGVASDNNFAEREIRPAVILRKNTYGNQSDDGAETQAILMSIFRTLRRRGLDPLHEINHAWRHYTLTDTLPPLPDPKP